MSGATRSKPVQEKAEVAKAAPKRAGLVAKSAVAKPAVVKPAVVKSAAAKPAVVKTAARSGAGASASPKASPKPKPGVKSKAPYDVHPGVAYVQAVVDNMGAKTGRTIDEWAAMVIAHGPTGSKARRDWLKNTYQLGGTTVWMIVEYVEGRSSADTDPKLYLAAAVRYVETMYAGPKMWLRPIHDALIALGRSLGDDVRVCPCQTIVPLYRAHVFAQVKPTTQSRIDFGLALKGVRQKLPRRLIDTGGLAKGDRITHRFEIKSPGDVDDEVRNWARIAYDLDA